MVFRLVARLDVKPPNVVKGIQLEGLRKVGSPSTLARQYFADGIDELHYQDAVASLYGLNTVRDLISETAAQVFLPITVGGGIRSLTDAEDMIAAGADKVSVNSHAIQNPSLIREISEVFGRQAVVASIEVKRENGFWRVMYNSGREHAHVEFVKWLHDVEEFGAGEIILTSIDQDGSMKGIDYELASFSRTRTNLPLLLHGGIGQMSDVLLAHESGVDGVVIASGLHYKKISIADLKTYLNLNGVSVRR